MVFYRVVSEFLWLFVGYLTLLPANLNLFLKILIKLTVHQLYEKWKLVIFKQTFVTYLNSLKLSPNGIGNFEGANFSWKSINTINSKY